MAVSLSSLIMTRMFIRGVPQMRYLSSSAVTMQQSSQQTKEKSKMRNYFVESYVRYMNYYEQKLQKRFPAAMKMYKLFTYGIKSFFRDVKSFVVIRLTVMSLSESEGFKELTRREIELYDQMPRDMVKISPVLLLSIIPFSNYVVFPLAFMYPHKLLTSHFWNDEQKEDYIYKILQKRVKYGIQALRCLNQAKYSSDNTDILKTWSEVLRDISRGFQPQVEKIIECKPLFEAKGPYFLRSLSFNHMRYLVYLHGMRLGFHPLGTLTQRWFILNEMDKAIVREGGVDNMTRSDVKNACFIRGFHTCSLTENESQELLKNWIYLSSSVDESSLTLLLHGPILLGFNIPSHFIKPKY